MSGPELHTPRTEAQRWVTKAADDRRVAALALAADPPIPDIAAFHVQQAAEKHWKDKLMMYPLR